MIINIYLAFVIVLGGWHILQGICMLYSELVVGKDCKNALLQSRFVPLAAATSFAWQNNALFLIQLA